MSQATFLGYCRNICVDDVHAEREWNMTMDEGKWVDMFNKDRPRCMMSILIDEKYVVAGDIIIVEGLNDRD